MPRAAERRATLVKDYKGDAAMAAGEAFDPTPANLDARTQRYDAAGRHEGRAAAEEDARRHRSSSQINLHFGDEKSLMNRNDVGVAAATMLMRGTTKHTRQQIEDEFDRLKARVSVGGWGSGLGVGIETTRENLPAVLSLVAEVLRHPSFDAKEVEKLRTERIAELESQKSEPMALGHNAFARHMSTYPKGDVRYVETIDEIHRQRQGPDADSSWTSSIASSSGRSRRRSRSSATSTPTCWWRR